MTSGLLKSTHIWCMVSKILASSGGSLCNIGADCYNKQLHCWQDDTEGLLVALSTVTKQISMLHSAGQHMQCNHGHCQVDSVGCEHCSFSHCKPPKAQPFSQSERLSKQPFFSDLCNWFCNALPSALCFTPDLFCQYPTPCRNQMRPYICVAQLGSS